MKDRWMEMQVKKISSPELLSRIVTRLNLESEWGLSEEQATARLQEMVEVELLEGTDVVSVTVRGYVANICADAANAVRDVYEQIRREAEQERMRRLTQNVDARIKEQEEILKARKAEGEAASASGQDAAWKMRRYENGVMLLNTIRELSARQSRDGIVSRPIETLEVARPGLPR